MIYSTQDFLQTLKAQRKAKKLSQQTLAAKIGLPQSHLSKIESGHVNLTLASFIEISRTLGLEPMLVPKPFVPIVKNLISEKPKNDNVPLYQLDDEDEGEDG